VPPWRVGGLLYFFFLLYYEGLLKQKSVSDISLMSDFDKKNCSVICEPVFNSGSNLVAF
jgi:hypothetical protein